MVPSAGQRRRTAPATPPAAGRRCHRPSRTMVSPRRSAASNCGKLAVVPAVVHFAVQLEPVDAGGYFDVKGARPPEDLAFGFDVPAGLHQCAHDARQLGGRHFPTWR